MLFRITVPKEQGNNSIKALFYIRTLFLLRGNPLLGYCVAISSTPSSPTLPWKCTFYKGFCLRGSQVPSNANAIVFIRVLGGNLGPFDENGLATFGMEQFL